MKKYEIIMIGGSAGSLSVLLQLLPLVHDDMRLPVVIVLHRKETDESSLATLLATKTNKIVKEIQEKEVISPNTIYLAPADYHLLIEKTRTFSLDFSEKVNYSRPSIDVCFESASDVFGDKLIGILLSGANADGMNGLVSIKDAGGYTIAQDPESAEVPFMPQQAINHSNVDAVMNEEQLAKFLNSLG